MEEAAAFGMECQLKEWKTYLVKLKEWEENMVEIVEL